MKVTDVLPSTPDFGACVGEFGWDHYRGADTLPAPAVGDRLCLSLRKEVIKMPYGFGGGRGIGFRGSSPPWPYVGRGRGGLPRCAYPGASTVPQYGGPAWYGPHPAWGSGPSGPVAGQELDALRQEANAMKAHLNEVEARMRTLEDEQK